MPLPDPSRVRAVDYGVLRDVVIHIMTSPARTVPARAGDLPELGARIELNHLGGAWAALLRNAANRAGHVNNFFAKNSTVTKQALKDHLVATYRPIRDAGRAIQAVPTG